MIGAAVVLVLGGLVIPITMLLAALVFDVCVVLWVLFHVWHDDWAPRAGHLVSAPFHGFGVRHRPSARHAH